jgi:hypothetical protein
MLSTGLNRQDNKNGDLRRRGTVPCTKVDDRLLNPMHKEFHRRRQHATIMGGGDGEEEQDEGKDI